MRPGLQAVRYPLCRSIERNIAETATWIPTSPGTTRWQFCRRSYHSSVSKSSWPDIKDEPAHTVGTTHFTHHPCPNFAVSSCRSPFVSPSPCTNCGEVRASFAFKKPPKKMDKLHFRSGQDAVLVQICIIQIYASWVVQKWTTAIWKGSQTISGLQGHLSKFA